jgi:ATP-dependent Clp protease ATP-binding subunit ClpC
MFERFTDRARRIVVLAQEEARRLDHHYVGTEHLLLGLLSEGDGLAVHALTGLGIDLEVLRAQVEERVGRGQPPSPAGHIPFTPPAKVVLEMSLREALQLGHNHIGTEHILLGMIREGDGVAAQVLTGMGANASNVRRQVIMLLQAYREGQPGPTVIAGAAFGPDSTVTSGSASTAGMSASAVASGPTGQKRRIEEIGQGIDAIVTRLAAIEGALGIAMPPVPEALREYARELAEVRRQLAAALEAQQFEQATTLREQEKRLIRERGIEYALWLAQAKRGRDAREQRERRGLARGQGDGVDAGEVERLSQLVERLQAVLREHDIDTGDGPRE